MNNDSSIDRLNHLIEVNKDAEAGFRTAAESVRNSEIETLFSGYASRHAQFVMELTAEIQRLKGDPADSGTLGGALHRGWMGITSALSGHSAAGMLNACENGEQSAESAYLDAADVITTGQTHTLVQKHCKEINGFRTRLARLVGEAKDGVEFQKNEVESD